MSLPSSHQNGAELIDGRVVEWVRTLMILCLISGTAMALFAALALTTATRMGLFPAAAAIFFTAAAAMGRLLRSPRFKATSNAEKTYLFNPYITGVIRKRAVSAYKVRHRQTGTLLGTISKAGYGSAYRWQMVPLTGEPLERTASPATRLEAAGELEIQAVTSWADWATRNTHVPVRALEASTTLADLIATLKIYGVRKHPVNTPEPPTEGDRP